MRRTIGLILSLFMGIASLALPSQAIAATTEAACSPKGFKWNGNELAYCNGLTEYGRLVSYKIVPHNENVNDAPWSFMCVAPGVEATLGTLVSGVSTPVAFSDSRLCVPGGGTPGSVDDTGLPHPDIDLGVRCGLWQEESRNTPGIWNIYYTSCNANTNVYTDRFDGPDNWECVAKGAHEWLGTSDYVDRVTVGGSC
ncbi:hypothetical protein ACIRD2_33755 [Streptomyces sp. NPDC093595]|uniref:hypothetical protein n=1 Tax=Streptomyces sp. NPDC093595 TaxID=3366045 RepID=UPI0038098E75